MQERAEAAEGADLPESGEAAHRRRQPEAAGAEAGRMDGWMDDE